MSIENGIFAPAYSSARTTGMATAYIISNLIICPAILADFIYTKLNPEQALSQTNLQCDIRIYDIAHLIVHEEIKSSVIYQGGFFTSSRALKISAELTASLCNALVTASTFILTSLLEIALSIAFAPIAIIVSAAAIVAGSIYCLARSHQIGFQEQCVESINYLSENVL